MTDVHGASDSEEVEVSPGNTPPEPAIAAPATYRDGQTIDLGGSADDAEDGDVPASAYEWDIELMHGTHRHPKTSESGVTSTSFEASTDHDADSHYRRAPVSYAGSSQTSPFTTQSAIGFVTSISAAQSFTAGGRTYEFRGWSDGGTRLHDGDSSKSTIFSYDSGAAMAGLAAPARRLGFFLSNSNATALTTNGWKLFDAAVGWAKNGS